MPNLRRLNSPKSIINSIDNVVDKYGEIKDNASPDLLNIRRSMNTVRGKVNQSFGASLTHYNSLGYLDEIRESFVQNRRVLAVFSDVSPQSQRLDFRQFQNGKHCVHRT